MRWLDSAAKIHRMERMLLDEVKALREEAGPPQWNAAVDRVAALFSVAWRKQTMGFDGNWYFNGATAMVLGIYLITRTQGVEAGHVTRQQFENLLMRRHQWERVADWELLLREAGHDPEDPDDLVAARWRYQASDMTPPPGEDIPDDIWADSTMIRTGPRLGDFITMVLATHWGIEF